MSSLENSLFSPVTGRAWAIAMLALISCAVWPVLFQLSIEYGDNGIIERLFKAFLFWFFVCSLVINPPFPFFSLLGALFYSISLSAVTLLVEVTTKYVVTGQMFWYETFFPLSSTPTPYPFFLGMFAVDISLFFIIFLAKELTVERKRGDAAVISRIALNPWVTLFGIACSALGALFTIKSPQELWRSVIG